MASVSNAVRPLEPGIVERGRRAFLLLCACLAPPIAALFVYAVTRAYAWDEGFHIMAARLIKSGKRPYLDFCFPQTPLNAYWNALWLTIFGDSWRAVHVVAAILTSIAVLLTAQFVLTRFPVRSWRFGAALSTGLLMILNSAVFQFGPIAQAYAMCLLLSVAGFRLATLAVGRENFLWTAAAGACISGAAAGTMLSAPATPVVLVWLLVYNRAGNRLAKAAAFVAGAVIPFLPVIWLFIQDPYKTFFNVLGYQLFYRRQHWDGAGVHDVKALSEWLYSVPALFVALLAIAGVLFLMRASGWERARRAEYYLAAWMAVAMGLEVASAHPTFSWYFLVIVPFLAIPASVGIYVVGSRLYRPDRPRWPVAVLVVLLALAWGRAMMDDLDSFTWQDMEKLSQQVAKVTPPNATLWADEHIYFLLHRPIPEGMEFEPARKLDMPMTQAAPLHILPGNEIARRVKAGFYHTIANCDDDKIKELHLKELYAHSDEGDSCTVFWDFVKPAAGAQASQAATPSKSTAPKK